jgi:tetratricopeptide (TPR) repeat protein
VAVQRQAWVDALAACQAVLQADVDAGLRLDAQLLLATVRRRQSDPAAAEAALDAAMADAVRAGPARLVDLGLARIGLLNDVGRAGQALLDLQRLLADPALQPGHRWRLLQEQAAALSFLGRHDESLPLLRQVAAELPPSALGERLRVLSMLARNAYWAGDLDEARAQVGQSLVLARSLGDEHGVASSLYRLGVLDRERGDIDRAQAQLLEAAEGARRCGHVELLRSVLSTLATVRLNQMRLDEAEALIVEGEQAAPYWDLPAVEDVYDERRLLLHQLRGEVDAAWRVCRRSIERTRAMQHQHFHLASLLQAVCLAVLTDDAVQARRYLDEALDVHDRAGADSLQGRELAAREVLVLQAEGRHREALRRAQAWLDAPLPRRVEEHAQLLAAAAHAALDAGQPQLAEGWAAQAAALPAVPVPALAQVLAARMRVARQQGHGLAALQAEARAWLAQPVLPVLHARHLQAVLDDPGQQPQGTR